MITPTEPAAEQSRPHTRLSINVAHDTAGYLKTTADALGITVTELIRRCVKLDKLLREETESGAEILIRYPWSGEMGDGQKIYRKLVLL